MVIKRITMVMWLLLLLLASLFCKSTQDENDREHGVLQCGPQNVTLTSSGQTILSTWQDTPSCFAIQDVLIYELVVLIADKQVHYDKVAVLPDQIGSTHSWNWTSYLALECASHSVRLSSPYKNHTSQWKPEQTLPGRKKQTGVFPKDKRFKVGSRVTFCCVIPPGEVFKKMYLAGYSSANMNTKVSSHVYTLTVHLNQASKASCTNVICDTNATREGACTYIGYPPDVSDLQCETPDLESVECHWREGGDTDITLNNPTDYQLLGSPCTNWSKERCSQNVQVDVGERKWTLTAENMFGKVEVSDTADLTKRVHMFPPKAVTASTVNARDVRLEWEWTVPQYNELNISCQVNMNHGGNTTVRSEHFGVGLKSAVLKDLIPNWTCNVTVRCGTVQHFWKWSEWSTSVTLHTKGDVPDALDVWMQRKDDQTITIWKIPLANQSHGHIENYEVTWTKASERELQYRTKVGPNESSLALSLSTSEEYIVTVTARNMNGSSAPSPITIPSCNPDRARVNSSQIVGSDGSFRLSWSASPAASCGYIVDWCPSFGKCTVEWLKVPPNETKANLYSKNFKAGLRYSLSVYACTQGAPLLLEKREGYVSEKRIEDGLFKSLRGKQQDSDFQVSWDPISLREQSAFIQGYILYCLDGNNKVISFSTDDPEVTSLTARHLKISSYTFTVMAKTAVGECGAASITATLNSLTDNLIKTVFISMVTVFGVLSLITALFYRHWTCIKHKVYPPIPKPVLTAGEHRCRPLLVDQCHYSEADVLDIPELLSASLFRGVFSNPSYNLMMECADQQPSSGPELQEGASLERSSGGYQAHDHTESFIVNQAEEAPQSPTPYVSTDNLLPH